MEMLIVLYEYLKINKWKYLRGLITPLIIGVVVYFCTPEQIYLKHYKDFYNALITILGIMIGFTISVFSVLVTMDNENIREAKSYPIKDGLKLYNKKVTLYDGLLINYIYIIALQIILLLTNLITPFFCNISLVENKIFIAIDVAVLFHVFIAILSNIVDFYFILSKKR